MVLYVSVKGTLDLVGFVTIGTPIFVSYKKYKELLNGNTGGNNVIMKKKKECQGGTFQFYK